MKTKKTPLSGFTLIELLTVIAIIGILAAILIPTITIGLDNAARATSLANLKSIHIAHQSFQADGSRSRSLRSGDWSTSAPLQANSPSDFAKSIAWYTEMNDAAIYFIKQAGDVSTVETIPNIIFQGKSSDRTVDPDFEAAEDVISYSFARILPNSSGITPLGWTKGLQTDGTWETESPWGGKGGHILFAAGNVEYFKELSEGDLRDPDGKPIKNINEAFTDSNRILEAK